MSVRPRPSWPSRDRLTVSPPAVNIVEGQTTRVVCTGTTNVPSGSIGWIRQDGAPLRQNVRPENGVLVIENARPDNAGVYVCQTTSSEIYPVPVVVSVEAVNTPPPSEAPSVAVIGIDRVTVPTGEKVLIDCVPSGYPLPLVRWKKVSHCIFTLNTSVFILAARRKKFGPLNADLCACQFLSISKPIRLTINMYFYGYYLVRG